MTTTDIAKVGIELARKQLPGLKVARRYIYAEWHMWSTYFEDLVLKNSDNRALHFVEVSGTAPNAGTQNAVMAITGNGPTSAEHAAFIVHACNNFEALAKRVLELEAERDAVLVENEDLVQGNEVLNDVLGSTSDDVRLARVVEVRKLQKAENDSLRAALEHIRKAENLDGWHLASLFAGRALAGSKDGGRVEVGEYDTLMDKVGAWQG